MARCDRDPASSGDTKRRRMSPERNERRVSVTMFNRAGLVLLVATTALIAPVTSARAQQTLNFTLGYFTVHGEDARPSCSPATSTDCDVLVKDQQFLSFDIADFNGATV